jgi:hypothetical protein
MKNFPRASGLLLLNLMFSLLLSVPAWAEEGGLIPPSRTIEGSGKTPGNLMVTSEPPGLEVHLDGARIGQTPLQTKPVDPGMHALRIEHAETTIQIEPGKTTKVSLFKGSFVTTVEDQSLEEPSSAERSADAQRTDRRVTLPSGEEKPGDLTPWERFLNRTSPNF